MQKLYVQSKKKNAHSNTLKHVKTKFICDLGIRNLMRTHLNTDKIKPKLRRNEKHRRKKVNIVVQKLNSVKLTFKLAPNLYKRMHPAFGHCPNLYFVVKSFLKGLNRG